MIKLARLFLIAVVFFSHTPSIADGKPSVRQWHLKEWPGANVEKAWEITRGNPELTLAIVDNNFSKSNRFLDGLRGCSSRQYDAPNLLKSDAQTSTIPIEHGTYVTQVAAACPSEDKRFYGVDWHSNVLLLDYKGNSKAVSELMLWASGDETICKSSIAISCPTGQVAFGREKADVINWSGALTASKEDSSQQSIEALKKILFHDVEHTKRLVAHGAVIVKSSGNNGRNTVNPPEFIEDSMQEFIRVGATNKDGDAAGYSNWGKNVDIMAPGDRVSVYDELDELRRVDPSLAKSGEEATVIQIGDSFVFPIATGTYVRVPGTSFATPIVSGALMLVKDQYNKSKQQRKPFNRKVARYILQKTAIPMRCDQYCSPEYDSTAREQCRRDCCVGDRQICTAGMLNAHAAVLEVQKGCPDASLWDSDRNLIRVKKNAAGLYQGDFVLRENGCPSKGKQLPNEILPMPGKPDETSKFEWHLALSDEGERLHVTFVQKEAAKLPEDFEMNLQVSWQVDEQMKDALSLVAVLDERMR